MRIRVLPVGLQRLNSFQGRMLILDLQSELSPYYGNSSMYYGQPFIWNMLLNFGGVLGMYGALDTVNTVMFHSCA